MIMIGRCTFAGLVWSTRLVCVCVCVCVFVCVRFVVVGVYL